MKSKFGILASLFLPSLLSAQLCTDEFCSRPVYPITPTLCEEQDYGGCGVCGGVEGLYWTVFQSNLDYAVDFTNEEGATEILGDGKTHFLDYDWRGGARGFLGYHFCGWDIRVVYTWYTNEAEGEADPDDEEIDLKASLLHPSTFEENAERATGRLDLDYQTLDLLFGRSLCLCDHRLIFHPFFGLRFLKIEQDLKVTYEGEDFINQEAQPFIGGELAEPGRVLWDSKWEGVGLHAGFDLHYRWVCGLGLYGSAGGSILAARTDNNHRQVVLDEEGVIETTLIELEEKQHVAAAGYHLQAGVMWETCCGRCFTVRLKAGYEFNQWFNTPQLRRYHYGNEGVSSSATEGHIGLHGGTCSIELKF